jgi:hypothetical protein
MKNRGSLPGYPRIDPITDGRFLLLGTVGAAELAADESGTNWKLADVTRTPDFQKRMYEPPPEYALTSDAVEHQTVKETGTFRYELVWQRLTKPGVAIGRQYLRKVEKGTGHRASQLLVGESSETID